MRKGKMVCDRFDERSFGEFEGMCDRYSDSFLVAMQVFRLFMQLQGTAGENKGKTEENETKINKRKTNEQKKTTTEIRT